MWFGARGVMGQTGGTVGAVFPKRRGTLRATAPPPPHISPLPLHAPYAHACRHHRRYPQHALALPALFAGVAPPAQHACLCCCGTAIFFCLRTFRPLHLCCVCAFLRRASCVGTGVPYRRCATRHHGGALAYTIPHISHLAPTTNLATGRGMLAIFAGAYRAQRRCSLA